jgi:hypothetical protein
MLSSAVATFGYQGLAPVTRRASNNVVMYDREKGSMYDNPYAPAGMGREFIDAPRKPLSEYVGASKEFNLGPNGASENFEPWDPWSLSLLHKVSANNPDAAWLREAELKHGRVAMLAFVGILVTSAGIHWPAPVFEEATAAGWPNALGAVGPSIQGQMLATVGLIEGFSLSAKAGGEGRMDLYYGERPGGPVAGDLGFDPLGLLSKDPAAADKMREKELKNGRLAMLAVMGMFAGYLNTGNANLFGPA